MLGDQGWGLGWGCMGGELGTKHGIYIYICQTWVGSGMWIFAWLARFALLGWVTGAGWGIYQF